MLTTLTKKKSFFLHFPSAFSITYLMQRQQLKQNITSSACSVSLKPNVKTEEVGSHGAISRVFKAAAGKE